MKKIDIIKNAIEEIKPYINADGGDIEFIKYENNYVYIHLSGACASCLGIDSTINNGIYIYLHERLNEIKGVINVPL